MYNNAIYFWNDRNFCHNSIVKGFQIFCYEKNPPQSLKNKFYCYAVNNSATQTNAIYIWNNRILLSQDLNLVSNLGMICEMYWDNVMDRDPACIALSWMPYITVAASNYKERQLNFNIMILVVFNTSQAYFMNQWDE